jgi:hypothetical protein
MKAHGGLCRGSNAVASFEPFGQTMAPVVPCSSTPFAKVQQDLA